MKRPTIKVALTGALTLVAVAMVGFSGIAISSLSALNGNTTFIAEAILPQVSMSKEMETVLSDLRRSYLNHVVALDDAARDAATQSVAQEKKRFKAELAQYTASIDTAQEKALVDDIGSKFDGMSEVGKSVLELSSAGKPAEAVKLQQLKLKPIADEIRASLDQLATSNEKEAETAKIAGAADYASTMRWMVGVLIVCLGILSGVMYFAFAGIARPIQQITHAMLRLASGATADAIPYQGRHDEIGAMAGAVEVFRANALANHQLEADAQANRQASEQERQRVAALDEKKAAEMQAASNGLAEGLKHLAAGNLAYRLESPFAAEYEALRSNFNTSVGQLAVALKEVAESATSIDTGAREIASAAADLCRRTENQAAALEETAAALDEISSNVASSSQVTGEARTVAVDANASTGKSRDVVANAIAAMGRIDESSRQITNIISVIDEIAFQTNLLALNAGVEAARAVEAGKGFAVVAQEVRELAQRSASAAKEIKNLIAVSTQEVQGGVQLVQDTGDALNAISQHVVTINKHMEAISTSYREQSTGLAEVNTAVNQMDQVTQQNAAMVEQATAASATLSSEANRLRELIGQFDLGMRHAEPRKFAA